ncbi:cytochrome C oxidase Cbb3 [Alginatibacterium sediminis]|uniref:Cytochrome C oxidase Cbb3 n=1 Tax=Alginatibacterium sediminis TaxID=2164068 RepID=A0A420EH86_9ALTE|nr:FixH family protein [Alginatibacterium sediminis]RKF20024.1 cytochrome C oxidase Cbb3 [Alginatibacterium sediminis]
MDTQQLILPWYKQFWPWFLIALPAAAVIASISTFFIANNNKSDLVVDSYYKVGKSINQDLSKLKAAETLGISADLESKDGALILSMQVPSSYQNQALEVKLAHKTQAKKDLDFLVTADANGRYRFGENFDQAGRWFIRIEPIDGSWRLQEELVLPLTATEAIDGQ